MAAASWGRRSNVVETYYSSIARAQLSRIEDLTALRPTLCWQAWLAVVSDGTHSSIDCATPHGSEATPQRCAACISMARLYYRTFTPAEIEWPRSRTASRSRGGMS